MPSCLEILWRPSGNGAYRSNQEELTPWSESSGRFGSSGRSGSVPGPSLAPTAKDSFAIDHLPPLLTGIGRGLGGLHDRRPIYCSADVLGALWLRVRRVLARSRRAQAWPGGEAATCCRLRSRGDRRSVRRSQPRAGQGPLDRRCLDNSVDHRHRRLPIARGADRRRSGPPPQLTPTSQP